VGHPVWYMWDEPGNGAYLGDVIGGERMLDQLQVMFHVAVDECSRGQSWMERAALPVWKECIQSPLVEVGDECITWRAMQNALLV